jgi:negative regulator of sigma E activity
MNVHKLAKESKQGTSAFMDSEARCPGTFDDELILHKWERYHLIGEVLRHPAATNALSSNMVKAVRERVECEPPLNVSVSGRKSSSWRYAVAATVVSVMVATVAWLANQQQPVDVDNGLLPVTLAHLDDINPKVDERVSTMVTRHDAVSAASASGGDGSIRIVTYSR